DQRVPDLRDAEGIAGDNADLDVVAGRCDIATDHAAAHSRTRPIEDADSHTCDLAHAAGLVAADGLDGQDTVRDLRRELKDGVDDDRVAAHGRDFELLLGIHGAAVAELDGREPTRCDGAHPDIDAGPFQHLRRDLNRVYNGAACAP